MTDLDRSELTRWVAEHAMGFDCYPLERPGYSEAPYPKAIQTVAGTWVLWRSKSQADLFDPCTKIEHAFMLVERMRELGWLYSILLSGAGEVCVQFWKHPGDGSMLSGHAVEDTAAEAITQAVRAALEARNDSR